VSIFETLRERVVLRELAERHTELKGSGDKLRGRCPFPDHQDDTPSFYLYPDQRFYCFGCRKHGDVTDLLANTQGIEPGIEAALDLAREYGVEPPERDPEARRKHQERREREAEYVRQAEACHKALSRHESVAGWWESRGFDHELRERFLLGANRDGTAAVVPFWNRGRVKGLIERRLRGEPKYLCPRAEDFPEGCKPLFIPGPVRAGACLVEGFVDALALAALGQSVAAVGGTGISERQMRELKRLPAPLYILPDADEEGAEAARGWVRELYPRAMLCPPDYESEVSHA